MDTLNPADGDLLKTLPADIKRIHALADQDPEPGRIDKWRSVLSEKNKYLVERTCRSGMELYEYKRDISGIRLSAEINRMLAVITNQIRMLYRKFSFHFSCF